MRKDNVEIKMNTLAILEEIEYTSTYAFAIREDKMVKMAIVENANQILPSLTYCEKRGKDWVVRMLNTKEMFETIKDYAREIIDLCSISAFEEIYVTQGNRGGNNRGHIFEKLCADRLGGYQVEKKNAKCIDCGDIVANGEHIQCKLWNASVTTEITMLNLLAEKTKRELDK